MLTHGLKGRGYEENYNFDYGFEDVTEDDDYTKLLDVIFITDHTKNPFVPENYVVTSIADHDLLTNYIGLNGKE